MAIELKFVLWHRESIEKYREKCEECDSSKMNVQEAWAELKAYTEQCLAKRRIKWKEKDIGHIEWWDKQWKVMKRKVKNVYRKWKKENATREEYLRMKRKMRTKRK